MAEGQWYWCLKHHRVEPYGACKSEDRLGPYATEQEAAAALDTVAARNEQWDAADRRENEDDWDEDRSSPFGG